MERIKVKKETVLETLKKNKKIHRDEFEDAMEGWIKKCKDKLQELIDGLNSENARSIKIEVYLPKPVSYEKEYDKAIKMIEYEIRNEIEISANDFGKYFLDEWAWKENFLSNTGLYKVK